MATTYDKASLVMIPSGYKDDKLYSIKPTDGSGDFTFSRDGAGASPATRVNASGLIEKGRENVLLQSNQFDTTWTNTRSTETSGQSGYDGTNDAWLLECNANGDAYLRQTYSNSGVQTFSFYAKAGSVNFVQVYITGADSSHYFNLSAGTAETPTGGGKITSKITSVGSGWYRCECIHQGSATGASMYIRDAVGGTASIGDNIYIQDAQLEQGLISTSYIETTTAPVSAGLLGDMPRLDYSGGATCPSLLLEPSRVNKNLQSEYFNTWYTLDNQTATANAAISPEGLQNATLIERTSSSGNSRLQTPIVTKTSGASVVHSYFVKAHTANNVIFYSTQAGEGKKFDLTTGTAGDDFISAPDDYGIEPYGDDGWYRIWIAVTTAGTAAQAWLYIDESDTSGFYVYGGMTEEGSYPTSYIPTYGSASTRGDDYQTSTTNYKTQGILGSTWTFLYDQTFVDVAREAASSLFLLDNGIGGDGLTNVRISLNSSGTFRLQDSDGTQLSTSGNKILCRYDGSTIAWFVDGSLLDSHNVTDTDFANLDQYNPSQNNKKKVVFNQLLIFPTSLTDAECIALTA